MISRQCKGERERHRSREAVIVIKNDKKAMQGTDRERDIARKVVIVIRNDK